MLEIFIREVCPRPWERQLQDLHGYSLTTRDDYLILLMINGLMLEEAPLVE